MGGSLSLVEIMAVLYGMVMHFDPLNSEAEDRDRLILSKGHGVLCQYAALKQLGLYSVDDLKTCKQNESIISAHPSRNLKRGIEFSSGSLGQGLSLGVGVALALRKKKLERSPIVYVVMGDGECDEGSVWEAAMAGHQYKLDNLCAIVDRNRLQISGNTEDVMGHDDLHERFKSFGWHVIDVADGNSIEQLHAAFEEAKQTKGQPTVLIANTVKGKGSAVMEDKAAWHHHVPTQEEYEQIMKDFEERKEQL